MKSVNDHLRMVTLPFHLHNRTRLRDITDKQQIVSCQRHTRLIIVKHCTPVDWVVGGAPPPHALLVDPDQQFET